MTPCLFNFRFCKNEGRPRGRPTIDNELYAAAFSKAMLEPPEFLQKTREGYQLQRLWGLDVVAFCQVNPETDFRARCSLYVVLY